MLLKILLGLLLQCILHAQFVHQHTHVVLTHTCVLQGARRFGAEGNIANWERFLAHVSAQCLMHAEGNSAGLMNTDLVEETNDLASCFLAPSLIVIHDARRSCKDNVTELHTHTHVKCLVRIG